MSSPGNSMRIVVASAALLLAWLLNAAPLLAGPEIKVQPEPLDRGAPGRVTISGLNHRQMPSGKFDGRPIFFFPGGDGFVGLFGADVMLSPGRYPLEISWPGGKETLEVAVRDKAYGVRSIKAPKKQVQLSNEDQNRAAREQKEVIAALETKSPVKLWNGPWVEPVGGDVTSSFGRQTRINGVLNPKPHAGADFKAAEGAEVKAPADGQVILTGDHFFAGKSVYIDHGQGVVSMYFHLSRIDVAQGERIKRGRRLGLSGATGRVDGAHLHYGLYICRARIDPVAFHRLTALLPRD